MWHQTVQTLSKDYSISCLCGLFGVSRQSYYQRKELDFSRLAFDRMLIEYVTHVRKDFPRLGGLKLYEKCKWFFGDSFLPGRDAFYRLLRLNGLMLKKKCRYKVRTTDSDHAYPRYAHVAKDFVATAPCQLWVSDITYVRTLEGFCYLSLITDAYSRKIVGWELADSLKYIHTENALRMAMEQAQSDGYILEGLIHHSDRGFQYAYPAYTGLLRKNGCRVSMTQSGDPLENALAERINGILKTEWLDVQELQGFKQAYDLTAKVIKLYNTQRPHRSLEMKTPEMVHRNQKVPSEIEEKVFSVWGIPQTEKRTL